jgi:hypothetical protein
MIGLLRRLGFALVIAAGTAGVLRFTKPPVQPLRRGGWRTLEGPDYR